MVMRTSIVPGSVRVALLCLSYTTFVVIIFLFFRLLVIVTRIVFPNVFPDFPIWENIATKITQNTLFSSSCTIRWNSPEALYIRKIPAFSRGLDYCGKWSAWGYPRVWRKPWFYRGFRWVRVWPWENNGKTLAYNGPIFYRCCMRLVVRLLRWGYGNRRAIRGRLLTGGFL